MKTTLLVVSVTNHPTDTDLKDIRTHMEAEFKACGLSVDFIVIPDTVRVDTRLISHATPVLK